MDHLAELTDYFGATPVLVNPRHVIVIKVRTDTLVPVVNIQLSNDVVNVTEDIETVKERLRLALAWQDAVR